MRNLIRLGGSLWAIGCLLGCPPNGIFSEKSTASGVYKWRVLLEGLAAGFSSILRRIFAVVVARTVGREISLLQADLPFIIKVSYILWRLVRLPSQGSG